MKKGVSIVLFSIVLLLIFGLASVMAQSDSNVTTGTTTSTSEGSKKAEQCLADLVKNKDSADLSLQEAVFATLAIGLKKNLDDKIKSEESAGCWPKSACTIRDTAQVMLAYDRIGRSTKDAEKWLTQRNGSTTELKWFLEIDIENSVASQCTLNYDGSDKKIKIGDDMKITGSAGTCFSLSSSGYWLEVKSNCFDKNITISCDQDFITSTLYQRSSGGTVYVSADTHSASSLGTTQEEVRSKCFKIGATCDYEGSLWAALALDKADKEIRNYLPYLLALADTNQKYFPDAFLYVLTGGDDHYSEVVQNQKQGKFWQITGSPYNRYYDTSLAMLALSRISSTELENARNYLLSIQTKEGCWNNNNIRDTGFILYGGWPKTVAAETRESSAALCEAASYFCGAKFACLDSGGKMVDGYECTNFGDSCCSVKVQEETCEQKSGILCSSTQECSGKEISSSDGSCCLSACQEVQVENTCEIAGATTCRFSCEAGESANGESCGGTGKICCQLVEKSGSLLWLWILLIILVILAVLGIIYKDKVRVWVYKFRKKAVTTPITRTARPISAQPLRPVPFGALRQPMGRPLPQPITRPMTPKEREMEDTLRKLRDMGR